MSQQCLAHRARPFGGRLTHFAEMFEPIAQDDRRIDRQIAQLPARPVEQAVIDQRRQMLFELVEARFQPMRRLRGDAFNMLAIGGLIAEQESGRCGIRACTSLATRHNPRHSPLPFPGAIATALRYCRIMRCDRLEQRPFGLEMIPEIALGHAEMRSERGGGDFAIAALVEQPSSGFDNAIPVFKTGVAISNATAQPASI